MQNLMILWRAWFLAPLADRPGHGSHRSRHPAREHRADILAILALKTREKETKC
jgi:hypothetical protein